MTIHPKPNISVLKEIVNAKTRKLSAKCTVEAPPDIITNPTGDILRELQAELEEHTAFERAVNDGWIPVDKTTVAPWPRDEVKAWMREECLGGYVFGKHHCAFEREADASNFILNWI